MITNNSLKEYYVKLQGLYDNAVNMLTAINQSLSSTASEVTITMHQDDGTITTSRIPSFLYLENKLEQLDTNFSNLFNMPQSGEAWFNKTSGMYKLNFVRTNTAPIKPEFSTNNIFASITDNNFLKDLVSPKTFLKINVSNLPDNIESMYMKKIVFFNSDIFNTLQQMNITKYEDYKAALYNFEAGADYEEYDSTIQLPIKKDTYQSRFLIEEIPDLTEDGGTNPWTDPTASNTKKLSYKLRLNTLEYSDQEDTSIVFTLKVGDYVCLGNQLVIYRVKNVNYEDMTVIIEEAVGHIALQTYYENTEMVLQIYNDDYSSYHYVQIPLEENPYICVFLGTISNNIRSLLSDAYLVDLNKIYIKDAGGNYIDDSYGNHMSYIDYYNKYCTNIGDLILGLTESAYPQLSNYNAVALNEIQEGTETQKFVSTTIDTEDILKVVPINKHLTDDVTSDEIINLHAQKNDINSQLQTIQDNINQVYTTIITTDFSQQVTISQQSLQAQIQQYYTERTSLQKQLNAIIDNINSKAMDLRITGSEVKYRIRGIAKYEDIEKYIQSISDDKVYIVGMDLEYKYKSTSKDTTSINVINSSTFTDWIKLENIDRQRKLVFNNAISSFNLDFVEYNTTDNIIKWNQIDIPIQEGEDVIIRVRYKINIGQPFFNLYTPWSDEMTMSFPAEYENNVEVTSIIDTNREDSIKAAFSKTLIDEGYAEHVQNKVVSSEQTFYHQPENIYSGFNTAENNLISLKDKLTAMSNDIEKYKTLIDNAANSKFEVYLTYDEYEVLLSPNTINKINVYNSDHITDSFIKKDMNIVIKNTGDVRLNLYSIFPGNTDIPLLCCNMQFYDEYIGHYERVPLFINNIISGQYLGQWIYFRQDNVFTGEDIYYINETQNDSDSKSIGQESGMKFDIYPSLYLNSNNQQVSLGYRKRANNSTESLSKIYWSCITVDKENGMILYNPGFSSVESINKIYESATMDSFIYTNYGSSVTDNKYLMRYEDIKGINKSSQVINLDDKTSIANFATNYQPINFNVQSDFNGAFLFPNILSKEQLLTEGGEKDSVFVEVGESKVIPIVFEYYVDGTDMTKISKSLYFDIRNSLISNPKHYMIEVTGNYDYTATGDIYSNIDNIGIEDNATTL